MTVPRPSSAVRRGGRSANARLFGNGLAVCMLAVATVIAGASTAERTAGFPVGHGKSGTADGLSIFIAANGNFNGNGNLGNFNGNGNSGNFNGNGNAGSFNGNGNSGSFNGNANCGNGFGNGFSSNGNGNGKGKGTGDVPAWCRYLKDLNGRLGLPPGVIP